MKTYYSISVCTDKPNQPLHEIQDRGFWAGLTANVRLAINEHAHIESRELAEHFLACCRPTLDRRYGEGCYETAINEQRGQDRHVAAKIEKDSAIIKARIRTQNFAPNKPAAL